MRREIKLKEAIETRNIILNQPLHLRARILGKNRLKSLYKSFGTFLKNLNLLQYIQIQ